MFHYREGWAGIRPFYFQSLKQSLRESCLAPAELAGKADDFATAKLLRQCCAQFFGLDRGCDSKFIKHTKELKAKREKSKVVRYPVIRRGLFLVAKSKILTRNKKTASSDKFCQSRRIVRAIFCSLVLYAAAAEHTLIVARRTLLHMALAA